MTLTELKNRALKRLRVLAAGETAPAYVDDIVAESYTSVYAELQEEGLVSWTSTGDIPNKIALHVGTLVVYESADEFSVPEPRMARLEVKAAKAMKQIRRLMATDYIPSHSEAVFY